MHKESLQEMKKNIEKYLFPLNTVVDVGSLNVRNRKGNFLGCYRDIIPSTYNYIGVDIMEGPNVDYVMQGPYTLPFKDGTVDAVISGQCFEHVKNPFKLMAEIVRVLKPSGWFIGVAPYKWEIHRFPVDCWRILPDGWASLFEESKLICIDTYTVDMGDQGDCWGIARKV